MKKYTPYIIHIVLDDGTPLAIIQGDKCDVDESVTSLGITKNEAFEYAQRFASLIRSDNWVREDAVKVAISHEYFVKYPDYPSPKIYNLSGQHIANIVRIKGHKHVVQHI